MNIQDDIIKISNEEYRELCARELQFLFENTSRFNNERNNSLVVLPAEENKEDEKISSLRRLSGKNRRRCASETNMRSLRRTNNLDSSSDEHNIRKDTSNKIINNRERNVESEPLEERESFGGENFRCSPPDEQSSFEYDIPAPHLAFIANGGDADTLGYLY